MSKPLYDKILSYIALHPSRFHMPAHFGGENETSPLYASAPFDVTELPFSDNLQNPVSVIAESEKMCAEGYGALKSYYYTTGATTAIFTALAAARGSGADIIVQRSSHKSVYSALRFFNYTPHYVFPHFDGEGFATPVTAEDLSAALDACPSASAAVITSPDYFGLTADAAKISALCRDRGILLIVDEAHGAHFPFSSRFPQGFSSLADMEITSLHKTLPVYTGGAVLNVNNIDLLDKITALRADIHTTSPSYTVLASIDYALDEVRLHGGKDYEGLYEDIIRFKDRCPFPLLDNDDFSRLVIKTGADVSALYKRGVIPETQYGNYSVFIVSPENARHLDKLSEALREIKYLPSSSVSIRLPLPEKGSLDGKEVFLPLSEAVGKTAAREVGIYPPGIPVAARGELITTEIAEILSSAQTFGFVNSKLCVIL